MLSYILFASPILLLTIVGILIRARGNPETAMRRYFLFLVWANIGSLALILISWMFPHPFWGYGMSLFPVIPGLIVLTLLNRREWNSLHRQIRTPILSAVILLTLLTIVQVVRIGLHTDAPQLEPIFFGLALLSITLFLFVAWKWGTSYPFLMSVFAILYLSFFHIMELGSLSLPSESMSGWMNVLGTLAYLAIPAITIPVMVTLTANALTLFPAPGESRSVGWNPIIGRLILIIILFGYLLYTFHWLSLWDGIDDGIRWLFMATVSGIAAISAGLLIALNATGWHRWAGLIFTIVVIGSIYIAGRANFGIGNEVTNYTVTEQRAARIQQALENHKLTTGNYPARLSDLVPGEMLRIPLPMIMPEHGWCYESGTDFYRLGAVYREHWSSPYFSVRIYAAAGNVPDAGWPCDEELAEAMSQSQYLDSVSTPVPLPTSAAAVQKIIVEPLVKDESLSVGNWSPDGAYLVFGLTEYFMDAVENVTIDLRFLDAKSGDFCQPTQSKWTVRQSDGLRDHSAWLADGRFLYVTEAGDMLAFTPCVDSVEDLANRYPVPFTHVMSSDKQGAHILLKNEDAYWLLNGTSLEVRKIESLPTESYRPLYDWSPGGEHLALSLMSGPEVEDEAFLYIVDWASGEVEYRLPLEDASDASLPVVEWLTRDELLLHGNTLTVMDFRSKPPITTDLIKEIFLLDIVYPLDVWGTDTVRSKDGQGYYIGVQVNHPRNKDAYVYSSKTGMVEVFHHDVSTLVFFADGQWMRLLKWDDELTTRDEYELVWMDQPGATTRLKVEGHVPRAHPQMIPRYLPDSSELVFSSSQGISLVSVLDGKTTQFWELAGNADYFDVIPSPNGEALIIASGGDGLYYIPLPTK